MIQAAIDLETTGLQEGIDEILEIAIIPYDDTFEPKNRFVTLIRPSRPIDESGPAYAKNKISNSMLKNAPTPLQVRTLFFDWKDNLFGDEKIQLLGTNIAVFDIPFLRLFFGCSNYQKMFHHRCRDTTILQHALEDAGIDVKKLAESILGLNYHRAEKDALFSLILWKKMVETIKEPVSN